MNSDEDSLLRVPGVRRKSTEVNRNTSHMFSTDGFKKGIRNISIQKYSNSQSSSNGKSKRNNSETDSLTQSYSDITNSVKLTSSLDSCSVRSSKMATSISVSDESQ